MPGRGVGVIAFEPAAQLAQVPERRPVSRVVQHLGHDLTPGPGITGPFHPGERRYRVLAGEQVIHRPPRPAALLVRDTSFTPDQLPTPRVIPVHLRSGQQIHMTSQQLWQLRFRVIRGYWTPRSARRHHPG